MEIRASRSAFRNPISRAEADITPPRRRDPPRANEGARRASRHEENALESALARPRQKLAHEPDTDLATLAAANGYGLASNHPYLDGNKRVAFMAMYTFLGLNGYEIEAEEEEVVRVILSLAAGQLQEDALADWLRAHIERFSE